VGAGWQGPLNQVDLFAWEIPRSYKPQMRTSGLIFLDEPMIAQLRQDQAAEQVANVATMPGIVGRSMAMPDIHWGYGFPIGGVAAFDYDEGVISPGGIGYDINCLSGDARVLSSLGYTIPIGRFERQWRQTPIACVNPSHRTRTTSAVAYMRFRANVAYRVRTGTGMEITATADHPFLTPDGMLPLKEVGARPVAIYPFRGVDFTEPPEGVVVTEEALVRPLNRAQRDQIVRVLRQKELIPLSPRHPAFPYLLRILGYALGDGHANLRPPSPHVAFWGRREDLEEIRKDVQRLGFRPSRVYLRPRHHKIQNRGGIYEFDAEEAWFRVNSSALTALLHAMGLPVGNKAKQDFVLPAWLLCLPLWQKRLFLAGLFGAEMSAPRALTGRGYSLSSPTFSIAKRTGFQKTGKRLALQVARMIADFGVRVLPVRSDVIEVPGSNEPSYRFLVHVASDSANLIKFYQRVNFEYHAEKRFLSNAAAYYLTLKEMVIRHHLRTAGAAETARGRGVSVDEVAAELTTLYVSRSFLMHRLYGRKGKPRVAPPFPTFAQFLRRLRESAGVSGVVWDRIVSAEEVPVDEVYDFTVADSHHNFIAEGFVVSNCGVRLLRTDLSESDVRPRIRALVDTMFHNVPSGVGEGGLVKVSRQDLARLATEGVAWSVEKGYAWPEDPLHIEANGHLADASFEKVSDRAITRGKDQVGSLGSGNHFLEVQKVDRIYDEAAAKALGIERAGQVCVMIHTGSRGFGHQIATDYIASCEGVVKREKIDLPDLQLACAPVHSKEGRDYWAAMCCGANFAWNNRQVITHGVRDAFAKTFGRSAEDLGIHIVYDVCHNIGKVEEHEVDGRRRRVVVHRKGATRAFPAGHPETPAEYREVGQPVLIPGDMGTCSFVLVGLPTSMTRSFGSSCHGAGRLMSRAAATRTYRANEVVRKLGDRGIYLHAATKAGIVEEAPGAYKNVEDVVRVAEGAGLTKIVARMVPIGVVKG
jgi:tRNA-splicing ligase RtcB